MTSDHSCLQTSIMYVVAAYCAFQGYLCLSGGHTERPTTLTMLTARCKDVSQKHCCRGTEKPFSSISQLLCTPAEFSSSHELLQGLSDQKYATMMPYLVTFEAFPVAGVLWATFWEYSLLPVRLAQVPSHQTQPWGSVKQHQRILPSPYITIQWYAC